jgi:hypothetical protein
VLRASQFSEDAGPMAHPIRWGCVADCPCMSVHERGVHSRRVVTRDHYNLVLVGWLRTLTHPLGRVCLFTYIAVRVLCAAASPPPLPRPESYIKMDNFYTVTVYEKVRHCQGGGGLGWGGGKGVVGMAVLWLGVGAECLQGLVPPGSVCCTAGASTACMCDGGVVFQWSPTVKHAIHCCCHCCMTVLLLLPPPLSPLQGAEVIRLYHTLLGPEGFRKGMGLYFKRHDGQVRLNGASYCEYRVGP